MQLSIIFLSVLALFKVSVSRGQVRVEGNVNIGALTSLHGRKNVAECGKFDVPALGVAESIVFAIEQINQDKKLLPDVTLGYEILDCCQSPVLGARNVYDFAIRNRKASMINTHNASNTLKPVVAVVGGLVSETALAVSMLLQAVGIPIIGSLATTEQLSSKFHHRFLRTIPADGNQAKAIADIIDFFGWNFVAAIGEDDSYGRTGILALEREARRRNTFCLGMTEFVQQSQIDRIPSIVYRLKQRRTVKVVVLWVLHSTGKALLDEATSQGVVSRTWIMSESLSMQQPEYLGEKLITQGNFIGVLPRRHVFEPFKTHIKKITPSNSRGNPWWEELWKTEFGCSPGKCKDDLRVTDALLLKLINDYVPFVIDAVYAIAHALDAILRCKEPYGLLKAGKCPQGTISRVDSNDLLIYLRNVSFQGLTGRVEFDSRGDPPDALYDIVYLNTNKTNRNFTQLPMKATIGSWEKRAITSLTLKAELIRWRTSENLQGPGPSECREECKPGERKTKTTDCCWECIECSDGWITSKSGQMNCSKCPRTQYSNNKRTACVDLPLLNIKWGDASSMMLIVISLIGILLSGAVLIILIKYKDTPVVKASNPEISFILLLATTSCFMLTFFYIATPTDKICALLQPLRYISFTSCCSILVLKTIRIVQAFQMEPVKALIKACIKTATRQLLSLGALVLVDVLLAVCWISIDPPHLDTSVTNDGFIFLSCRNFNSNAGLVLMMCMLIYLIVQALVCTYYAFRARKLPGNFNEAKYIAFSMYIILLSWIAYFPVGYALQGWYVAVVSCATSLVSGYGVLGCIFVPKIYMIFLHPEKNTTSAVRAELQVFTRVGTFTKSMISDRDSSS